MVDEPSTSELEKLIIERIAAGDHSVWSTADFHDMARRPLVDLALSRLNADQAVRRVAKGLYYVPRINALTKRPSVPDPAAVIDAVARRNGVRFIVDGMTAANDLGWEQAVPAQTVVYTDARIAPIQLGNSVITFKAVASSRLFWAGNPGMRVVQALHYFEDKLDREHEILSTKFERLLAQPDHGERIASGLRDGFQTMPAWMQDFTRPHLYPARDNDMPAEDEPGMSLR